NCTNIMPTGATEVAAGASETFMCEHTLADPGSSWTNVAEIEGAGKKKPSNAVVVKTEEEKEPEEHDFSINKLQKVGDEADFTKDERTGKVGEVVYYEIVVKN